MYFTRVPGLLGHVFFQHYKSIALFALMGVLFWGAPHLLPWALAWIYDGPLTAEQMAFVPIHNWWAWAVVFYLVGWLIHELASRAMISDAAKGKEHLRVRLLIKKLADRAGLGYEPPLVLMEGKANAAASHGIFTRGYILLMGDVIERLSDEEEEAVIAHEIAHLRHRDIIPMLLINVGVRAFIYQKVLLTLWLAYYMFVGTWQQVGFILVTFGVVWCISLAYSLLAAAFSRCREYLADAGGMALAGWDRRDELASGIWKIMQAHDKWVNIFKFLERTGLEIFMSHPLPVKRLEALNVKVFRNKRTGDVVFREQ